MSTPLTLDVVDGTGNPQNIPLLPGVLSEAAIDISSSGDNTIVAGVTAQTVKLYRLVLMMSAAVTVLIKDGASTTLMKVPSNQLQLVLDLSTHPWFTTSSGNALVINLSSGVEVTGVAHYIQS